MRARSWLLWSLATLLALAIGLTSLRYLSLSPEVFFAQQRDVYLARLPGLIAHVGGSIVALVAGPWQLLTTLRVRAPGVHRWIGRTYLVGVAVGSVGAFTLAPVAFGGAPARAGFLCLAVIWVITSVTALVRIRQGRPQAHRRWMIRSYSLTFAAVTLRIWLPLLQAAGLSFEAAYITVAWLSWVPNLALCEVVLAREASRGPAASQVAPP